MTVEVLAMIRRAIERGLDDQTILDMLTIAGVTTGDPTPKRSAVPRASIVSNAPAFKKPDTTRTVYHSTLRGSAKTWSTQLDKLGVIGNQRAVMDYVIQNGGTADSREMRKHVLRHKLDPVTGVNKAIESAVHTLKTRKPALLRAESKPEANGYTSETGITLDE